jgi:hypothetical protein
MSDDTIVAQPANAGQNMKDELLKAIELALGDQWDAAHRIAQEYDTDPTAAGIRAVLHKIEGDLGSPLSVKRESRQPAPAGPCASRGLSTCPW